MMKVNNCTFQSRQSLEYLISISILIEQVTSTTLSQEYSSGDSVTRYIGTVYGTGTVRIKNHYTTAAIKQRKICEECINCIGSLAYKIRQTLHCRKLLLVRFSENLSIVLQAKEDTTSSWRHRERIFSTTSFRIHLLRIFLLHEYFVFIQTSAYFVTLWSVTSFTSKHAVATKQSSIRSHKEDGE
jgi:hypothetical protein